MPSKFLTGPGTLWLIGGIKEVDTSNLESSTLVTSNQSIWRLGDFFGLSELCDLAIQNLQLKTCLHARTVPSPDPEGLKADISFFVDSILLIYKSNNKVLTDAFRPHIFGAAISRINLLAPDDKFNQMLDELPDFASDWAKEMMAGANLRMSAMIIANRAKPAPHKDHRGNTYNARMCAKCNKEVQPAHAQLNFVAWFETSVLQYLCEACFTPKRFTPSTATKPQV